MSLRLKTQHHVNGVVLGFFFVVLRGFFEDKTACVPFTFLCHIDTLPPVRGAVKSYAQIGLQALAE